jgi:hypothetical protein
MFEMNRRQFVASITATAVCPAADVAVISVANNIAGDPVGEIAAGWKPIGAAALEVMKFARSNQNLVD